MFNMEILIKIRAYILLAVAIIIFPIAVTFAWIYKILELLICFKSFKDIKGEVAVVTGAGHGLGRCIALLLAKSGCKVAVADINFAGAMETVDLIKSKYDVECKAYRIDVTKYEEVVGLNNKIMNDLGVVTILINNAGIVLLSSFIKPKPEEIQGMINVNLVSHFWTNSIFLENMKKLGKGHIVAVCSIAGFFPVPYNSQYVSTKFGVRGMMRSLRLELQIQGYNGIKTSTICPTFLQTNSDVVHYANEGDVGKCYPLVKGEDAAESIVNAMLRNEVEILIPRAFTILSRIFDAFPSAIQDTIFLVASKPFFNKFQKIFKQQKELAKEQDK